MHKKEKNSKVEREIHTKNKNSLLLLPYKITEILELTKKKSQRETEICRPHLKERTRRDKAEAKIEKKMFHLLKERNTQREQREREKMISISLIRRGFHSSRAS